MPLSSFEGNTFVAFVDISGFKELMKENKAWKALDKFYQLGYGILRDQNLQNDAIKIEGLFVTDCGILFVRGDGSELEKLTVLLKTIEKVNREFMQDNYMLKVSIAYGYFKYEQRIEFQGIEKNPVYGNAYLAAYLDNEEGKPRIQPGQCRIVIGDNLPNEIIQAIGNGGSDNTINRIQKEGMKHYYFYWNVNTADGIEAFKKRYNDAYNLKYKGMIQALKGN